MSVQLQGRIAVVVGASSGIGEAAARRLAAEGMTVVAAARRVERLEALAASDPRIEAQPVDVTSDESVDALAAAVEARHGAVHVLINSAGIAGGRQLRGPETRADLRHVMDVNFFGTVRTMTAFAPLLEASAPAQVINVSSVAGRIGVSGNYSASKFAVIGLSEGVAADWLRRRVTVTQLNPGYITTEGFAQEDLLRSPTTRWLVRDANAVADAVVDAIRNDRHERTVPRWYHAAVVARHVAAPLFWWGVRRRAG